MKEGKKNEGGKDNRIFSAISKLLWNLGERLEQKIKGQTYAIHAVQEALFEAFSVKTEVGGPKTCILLVGLSGV
jgi:ATP-dependent Clp protease ATP-binding subunit ClpA